jgi:hypothetical protein
MRMSISFLGRFGLFWSSQKRKLFLVVIDQINFKSVALLKTKDDAPVRPYSNAPEASKITCQPMEPEAGQVHVLRLLGSIEHGEDILHFFSVIGSDPFGFSLFKQPPQSPMPEASNHGLRLTVS